MFDHVTIRAADRAASERFYLTVLGAIGIPQDHAVAEYIEWSDFSLTAAEGPDRVTTGVHIGFRTTGSDAVDAFWRAGTGAGYRDDGPPGPRPVYGDDYYGGFLLDPDGNSAEGAWHGNVRGEGTIDHVWMRVADLRAAREFYEHVAAVAGLRITTDEPDRVQFSGADRGSFSLVAGGTPTRNVHMAFPAPDNRTVERFHERMIGAGYRDNGGPGERAQYHPGYYAAFVLDPDGNNIELVNHNRR